MRIEITDTDTEPERVSVLVVEDDPDQAELIERTLRGHRPPFDVTIVSDGRACLDALAHATYSLVLLDYSLPGMNGVDVLGRIREAGHQLPVVMVTGRTDERIAEDTMMAGGIDYVVKTPGYVAALPIVVRKVLKQQELAAENARLYRDAQAALARLEAAQEQLVRAETLRALGEVASGVAHHLNNLLTVVVARVDMMLANPACEPVFRSLGLVARAARDGAEVVRRIGEFARPEQIGETQAVDLNELARDVIELTRGRWSDAARVEGAEIVVEHDAAAPALVDGHPGALREVVTNVLLNAVDALPRGGRIDVRAWSDGHVVGLAVRDNGVGMPDAVRRRATEPFFTTKGPRSTGLGLSLCYGIVGRHGGTLDIESAEGVGTTVTIRLPAAAAARRTVPEPTATLEPAALRVMVVDDEPAVRDALSELLESLGHTVVQASGGREALRCLESGPAPDVMLTDLGMPEMTGTRLAATVRQRWPSILIGLVTGWIDNAPGERQGGAIDFVLTKPVQASTLTETLARVASARTSSAPAGS